MVKEIVRLKRRNEEKEQHTDFARGPPPHYYPCQNVLDFADQTGCGILTIVWPLVLTSVTFGIYRANQHL